ncbi:MAG: hypothetical protein A4E47_00088 [Methanosaeta sp. PtaU1.Bin028]|nr:MAG: hypothetical protein A4E47_00088 [Methanosaeta sp. PtaU1.Bin028]
MPMRKTSLALLIVLTMGICTAQVPNLIGNWTASGNGHVAGDGFQELPEGSLIFSIVEQDGRIFSGNVTYMEDGVEKAEAFAGAIGLDNKTLYRVEFGEGYSFGTIISDDEIEMIYLQDGEMGRVFIDRLHRIEE